MLGQETLNLKEPFHLRGHECFLKTGNDAVIAGKWFHSKIAPEMDFLHRRLLSTQSRPAAWHRLLNGCVIEIHFVHRALCSVSM